MNRVGWSIPSQLTHLFYRDVRWSDEYGSYWERTPCSIEKAEAVSSEIFLPDAKAGARLHAPILDIDVPAFLIPSSTEGHSHLYIDVPMKWWKYKLLLRALALCGIVEKGYVKASISRRHTALRVPWVRKELR